MKNWLKALFFAHNKESINTENAFNQHKSDMVQVDMSLKKKHAATRKYIDGQLEKAHKFSMVAHEPTCFILHPTDQRLDCNGKCDYKSTPDKIVGKSYIVKESHEIQKNINAIKEKDALLNEHMHFDEFHCD